MAFICEENTLASCGHPQTGSPKVRIGGFGVCRVLVDSAVGIITGPGSSKVFVEGFSVSLPGDSVTPHGVEPPHSTAPTTLSTQSKVSAPQ